MPQQNTPSVENNFTKGLITEFTGLNFPENAATDCNNVEFTLVGDVNRRQGINYESNYSALAFDRTNKAVSTYKWNNAGGDGSTQVVVSQIGNFLFFYKSNLATAALPLSQQRLASTVDISVYTSAGGTFDATLECDYANGNGYLFVYHPSCDPIYCTLSGSTVTGNQIIVQTRDFAGITEKGIDVSTRPLLLSAEHQYNLGNQGWNIGAPWQASSLTSIIVGTGSQVFTVASGLTITLGDSVQVLNAEGAAPGGIPVAAGTVIMSGSVTAYSGTSLTINVTSVYAIMNGSAFNQWNINPTSIGYMTSWKTAIGNYPSNSDVWWRFKNSSDVFAPLTTISNVTINSGPAPKGHYIQNAFNQDRGLNAGVAAITPVVTTARPRTGAWFQGRVWYAGVDSQQAATGDAVYYSWTENIYFSQIVNGVADFGHCYQTNDPTSEDLFDLLPTDGGVIQIQGSGAIYKLFPLQNALLVFAANGVWYITGSTGIGFAANDYTIYKLSEVRSISGTSIVNVNGFPYFWNEEGIYSVLAGKQGNEPDSRRNALEVNPITVGTILSFYNEIPYSSKKYARGAYNPIDYTIQWIYKSTEATTVASRYEFDQILNFNNYNNAFYPYSVTDSNVSTHCTINSITYVSSPGGSGAPSPAFKYQASNLNGGSYNTTFAWEYDTTYKDWAVTNTPTNYISYFVTGYKLHGQGQRRFQVPYIYIFSRADTPTSYKIQGLWDYAIAGDSGRWSLAQLVNNWSPNYGMIFRRHRIRGQGIVLQLKVTSVDGQPFDLMGWSSFETQNTGV